MTAPGLVFRGGAGGVSADLADMRTEAGVLLQRGAALQAVAGRAGQLAADPVLALSVPLAPLSAARAEACLADATAGLLGRAVRVAALATALRARADLVAAADALPGAAAAEGERLGGEVLGAVAVPLTLAVLGAGAAWAAVDAGRHAALDVVDVIGGMAPLAGLDDALRLVPRQVARDARGTATAVLRDHPEVTDVACGALPGFLQGAAGPMAPLVPGDPDALLRRVLAASAPVGLLRDGPVDVAGVFPPRPQAVPDARSLWSSAADLFDEADLDPDSTEVRVVRVGPAGAARWVVQVPGTKRWDPLPGRGAGDPSDVTSDVALMAAVPTGLSAGVVAAMAAAGVPVGADVLLMGHSQGGMVAAALAADPAVRARFHVTTVLTAGSPVARVPVPADVRVVALEHVQDPVPRLDARPDPDRPGWTTVTRDVRAELVAQQRAADAGDGPAPAPSAAHDARRYVETAGLLDAAADRAADGSRASADLAALRVRDVVAPFLGPGVAVDVRLQRRAR